MGFKPLITLEPFIFGKIQLNQNTTNFSSSDFLDSGNLVVRLIPSKRFIALEALQSGASWVPKNHLTFQIPLHLDDMHALSSCLPMLKAICKRNIHQSALKENHPTCFSLDLMLEHNLKSKIHAIMASKLFPQEKYSFCS